MSVAVMIMDHARMDWPRVINELLNELGDACGFDRPDATLGESQWNQCNGWPSTKVSKVGV